MRRRGETRRTAPIARLGLAFACAACAAPGSRSPTPIEAPAPDALEGRITFGAREALADGLSRDERERAARFVEVDLIDQQGRALGSARTDEAGRFRLEPSSEARAIAVVAHAREGAIDVATSRDAAGRSSHTEVIPIDRVRALGGRVHFAAAESEMAGALHIVDTLLRGSRAVERWTGHALPPFFVRWGRGVTTDWSYFLGEVPRGSGRYALELIAGPVGAEHTTDTDEHDEGIILHELGHFVMSRLRGNASIAGRHPPGALVDPGVAWEEGRASFFAMAVLAEEEPSREPWYRDTIGIVPTGSTRVNEDLEHPSDPRGLGSERSVAGVLWDLADGARADDEGAPACAMPTDRDDDGIALGAARVLREMERASRASSSMVALPGFLRHLVETGVVSEPALRAMLRATGEPDALLARPGEALPWPIELRLGVPLEGLVDGLSDPSPSGAPAKPDNGIDAVRVHHLEIPRAGVLVVELSIEGSGGAADRTALALELATSGLERLERAADGGARRTIRRRIEAGSYAVLVRDAGEGNRARYTLEARLEEGP